MLRVPAQGEPARRECRIGRIAPAQAPVLDGWLEDLCWRDAPQIGELVQKEPEQGAAPTQRTVVRLLHDEKNLYLAIECFDTEAGAIRATQRARDAELDPDDRVEWFFDTFVSRRDAYWFQIGAAGSLGDGLIANNGARFIKSFDAIWDGRSVVTEHGWQAEVVIPFQSLAFDPKRSDWGFNLTRERRSNNGTDNWTNARQGVDFMRVGDAGTLVGFGPRTQGLGVDVKPYVALKASRDRSASKHWDSDPDAGLDVVYRITPGLVASFTAYTDFAETEVDDRKINLTRFPLFFPEKRDFFLADSAYFDFGPSANSEVFVPYFSRRIGLDANGGEIPILAGIKVAGREGPWGVGFLDVVTEPPGDGQERQNLGVVRLKREIGAQGSVGFLATSGQPTGNGRNTVVGLDWSQRLPEFTADGDLRLSAYALGSESSGSSGDGHAFGVDAVGEGRLFDYGAGFRWIDDQFDPGLGFVRRRGVKEQYGQFAWKPRPGGETVRRFFFELQDRADFDLGNELADLRVELTPFGVVFESGDTAQFNVIRRFERVDTDFEIVPGVTVPKGDYWGTRYEVEGETSVGRPLSLTWRAETGELYGGESHDYELGMQWRTGPLLILGASWSSTRARLPFGSFTTHVEEARVDFHFSPRLSWKNLAQYDSESRDLGVQSRLRWTLTPGSDLFVVLGGGWLRGDDDVLRPTEQQGTVKLVYTLRF